MKYDVVIIGSGLGGLQCAYILSQGRLQCLCSGKKQGAWRMPADFFALRYCI